MDISVVVLIVAAAAGFLMFIGAAVRAWCNSATLLNSVRIRIEDMIYRGDMDAALMSQESRQAWAEALRAEMRFLSLLRDRYVVPRRICDAYITSRAHAWRMAFSGLGGPGSDIDAMIVSAERTVGRVRQGSVA